MESSLFNPLPPQPIRSRCFLAGWSLQLLLVAALLVLNTVLPKVRPPVRQYQLTSLVPYQPEVPLAPQPITPRLHVANTVTLPETKLWTVARAVLPPLARKQQPDIKVPELKMESRLPQLPAAASPRVVALNTFSTGSSAAPAITRPAATVQTGGFGDPQGTSPRPSRTSAAVSLAAVGAFDLPSGPGRGNGAGGATPGVVASAGFGNGIAVGTGRHEGPVRKAGFDAAYASSEPHKVAAALDMTGTPVAILFKPKPTYTQEGRKQGLDLKRIATGVPVISRAAATLCGSDEAYAASKPAFRTGPSCLPLPTAIPFPNPALATTPGVAPPAPLPRPGPLGKSKAPTAARVTAAEVRLGRGDVPWGSPKPPV